MGQCKLALLIFFLTLKIYEMQNKCRYHRKFFYIMILQQQYVQNHLEFDKNTSIEKIFSNQN